MHSKENLSILLITKLKPVVKVNLFEILLALFPFFFKELLDNFSFKNLKVFSKASYSISNFSSGCFKISNISIFMNSSIVSYFFISSFIEVFLAKKTLRHIQYFLVFLSSYLFRHFFYFPPQNI
ncbi:poly A polymerase [Fusobacterium animalis ATCC 51191]|uniref:Poly A polymerase n=1 Tax=Fusobacterium animalis ATCC 51191 TaxID=997347 RepID=F9EMA0_9FUSO|nr:poly A polymerase [Fusobacterium animalis ATCC 51191]